MVRVKICGITNWSDAQLALDCGADVLGFNFYPPSPRYILPREANRIIARLPRRVWAAGVFVNAALAAILRAANEADLGILQLHGHESPAGVRRLAQEYAVVKAFRVRNGFALRELARYPQASAFLLDGFDAHVPGGAGRTFDWRMASQASRFGPVVLAGGLNAENVGAALRLARPFAIDVCSSIERRPGKKDPRLLREFMRAVERARKELF